MTLKGEFHEIFNPPKFFLRNNLSLPLVDILMNFNLGFDFAEIIVSKARFFLQHGVITTAVSNV